MLYKFEVFRQLSHLVGAFIFLLLCPSNTTVFVSNNPCLVLIKTLKPFYLPLQLTNNLLLAEQFPVFLFKL
jgi:hypothetical protein